MTLKTKSVTKNHINSLFCHNDKIHKSLARIHCSIQEIPYLNPLWSKYDISKGWCDLHNKVKITKQDLRRHLTFAARRCKISCADSINSALSSFARTTISWQYHISVYQTNGAERLEGNALNFRKMKKMDGILRITI